MTAGGGVIGGVEVTPELVAELFWNLGSDKQADFFAALDSLAGFRLCFQMAGVISEIRDRADKGDYSAMNGLQTMLSHAEGYRESATEMRAYDAKSAIAATARRASALAAVDQQS